MFGKAVFAGALLAETTDYYALFAASATVLVAFIVASSILLEENGIEGVVGVQIVADFELIDCQRHNCFSKNNIL